MLTSARRAISYPNTDRSDRPDVPAHILNLVTALELDVIFHHGTDAARIAAVHQVGGGKLWWCTDTNVLWYDDGTTWRTVGAVASVFGRSGAVVKQAGDYAVADITGAAPLAGPTFTGTVNAPTPAVDDDSTKVATTAFVRDIVPAGVIVPYAGSAAPSGWLLCNGQAVSRTTYATLWGVLSTTYGAGDGSSTFNVPNLLGRVPVGKSASGTFATLAGTGGEETHVLTQGEMPIHTHTCTSVSAGIPSGTLTIAGSGTLTTGVESVDHTHSGTTASAGNHSHWMNLFSGSGDSTAGTGGAIAGGTQDTSITPAHTHTFTTGGRSATHTHTVASHGHAGSTFAGDALDTHTHTIGNSGSGTAHNNIQPYLVINYIIKT
jgi:microcystin-dependent protein